MFNKETSNHSSPNQPHSSLLDCRELESFQQQPHDHKNYTSFHNPHSHSSHSDHHYQQDGDSTNEIILISTSIHDPSHGSCRSSSSHDGSRMDYDSETQHFHESSSLLPTTTKKNSHPAAATMAQPFQNQEYSLPPPPGKSSSLSVLFNVSNATIGAGILAIPYSFHQSGVVLGSIILCVVCLIATLTAHFLIRACEISKEYTFKGIGVKAFQSLFKHQHHSRYVVGMVIDILMIVFCFGVIVGYISIVGDYCAGLFKILFQNNHPQGDEIMMNERDETSSLTTTLSNILTSRSFNCFLTVLILFPLTCLKRISFLFFTSYFAVMCVIYILLVIVVGFFNKLPSLDKRLDHSILLFQTPENIFQLFVAFPILFFSFGNSITLIPIYLELKNRSQKKMGHIVNGASLICLVCYLIAGIFGYIQFGDSGIRDNILNSFPNRTSIWIIFAKFSMIVVASVVYPLVHYPLRETLDHLLFPKRPFSYVRWIAEALIFAILIVVTLLIPFDLVTIFGLTGASFGMIVMFIFPCLFYALLETNRYKKWFAFCVAFICLVLGIVSTASVIYDFVMKMTLATTN
ncbi:hypothetical protein C9374_009871 [Naegleria lovaniensis]|uniref:Amino acid transporter transmembrane domain-containing protein n=1 Tax=Naegleria lovaniensis TaxID=51637 RepID=A0AA88GHF0_NAELO|nr:uncharacterized protein C9374_009871 [Naegleria lovaniensis]KAG2375248.1 hypothetical protein C9374_009871 [Naegleria lovaniensis]